MDSLGAFEALGPGSNPGRSAVMERLICGSVMTGIMARLLIKDLTPDTEMRGHEVLATAETIFKRDEETGPWGYGMLKDESGRIRVTYWEEPEFAQGDSILFKNVWCVDEYNGNLELKLGKFHTWESSSI